MDASIWKDASRAWVDAQELLDAMYRPLEDVLVAAAREHAYGGHVLDVGCGTGGTTLALAAAAGVATGVDVAEPMVAAARERATRTDLVVDFVLADAQTHAFPPRSFDLVASRFGVMFFADPVAAFANLRTATRPGGRLRAITWRDPAENPFMTAATDAARPLLPQLPVITAGGTGQFGLADPAAVRKILAEAGWEDVALERLDVVCTFPADALDGYLLRMGLVGRALAEADADDELRDRVLATVRPAFAPYLAGDTVRFTAACWDVSAVTRA